MGTHPIFESDFDCLTDVDAAVTLANPSVRPGRESHLLSSAPAKRHIVHVQGPIGTRFWRSVRLFLASSQPGRGKPNRAVRCDTGADADQLKGAMALVKRGSCSFMEKA